MPVKRDEPHFFSGYCVAMVNRNPRIHLIICEQNRNDVSIGQLASIEKVVKVACMHLRTVIGSHTIKIKRTPLSEGHSLSCTQALAPGI